jgi:murein DD-endopeptidase MepM/ murein hydrolase activator NlpD
MRRPGLIVALVAALLLLCMGGATGAVFFGLNGDSNNALTTSASGCGLGQGIDPSAKLPGVGGFDADQMRNAAIIIQVGQQLKVPPRGWVIGVATAIQESALRNLPDLGAHNDHDSIGLFQQRPSQGWGTPQQLIDPSYTARKFFEKLVKLSGWEKMALTSVAQAVQVSAYPDAYAKHEPVATAIVDSLTGGAGRAVGSLVSLHCTSAGEIAASGWTVPVKGPIVSGFRTPDRPTHNGVDLAVPKGTVVRAAASGQILVAMCDKIGAAQCNQDGGLGVPGCGWYVDILHAGNVITRYCHMVRRPDVVVGQMVSAGEQIGLSGTSGNSSGPHLHFEVHQNGDAGSTGAINPVPFMADAGAPLGAA